MRCVTRSTGYRVCCIDNLEDEMAAAANSQSKVGIGAFDYACGVWSCS